MSKIREKYETIYLGKKIRINHLQGEDGRYEGKEGVVTRIDDMGNLHGSWGGLSVIVEEDDFSVIG
jgi:hypothetical protein